MIVWPATRSRIRTANRRPALTDRRPAPGHAERREDDQDGKHDDLEAEAAEARPALGIERLAAVQDRSNRGRRLLGGRGHADTLGEPANARAEPPAQRRRQRDVQIRHRLAILLLPAIVAGCELASMLAPPVANDAPAEIRAAPASEPADAEIVYPYPLYSHCGITPTAFDFDGSFWDVAPPPVRPANAPRGIDDPVDEGTIVLTEPDRATFISRRGIRLELVRSADDTGCRSAATDRAMAAEPITGAAPSTARRSRRRTGASPTPR